MARPLLLALAALLLAGLPAADSAPVGAGTNRVLVGHRTPAILVLWPSVAGKAFPEGSALVIEPPAPRVPGILELAPLPGGGFHTC